MNGQSVSQFMNGQSVSLWMVSQSVYEWSVGQFMNGQSVFEWSVGQFMNDQLVSVWLGSRSGYEWSSRPVYLGWPWPGSPPDLSHYHYPDELNAQAMSTQVYLRTTPINVPGPTSQWRPGEWQADIGRGVFNQPATLIHWPAWPGVLTVPLLYRSAGTPRPWAPADGAGRSIVNPSTFPST